VQVKTNIFRTDFLLNSGNKTPVSFSPVRVHVVVQNSSNASTSYRFVFFEKVKSFKFVADYVLTRIDWGLATGIMGVAGGMKEAMALPNV